MSTSERAGRTITWNRTALAMLAAVAVSCQKDEVGTKEKLDRVLERVDKMDRRIAELSRGGGAAGAPAPGGAQPVAQPRPAAPDPNLAYSVPIEGSPAEGPPTAKVTIVEAADFA
jgi:hypothetical protein